MNSISKFYTLFWIAYFPICIAFTYIVNFDFSDELLMIVLVLYAFVNKKQIQRNSKIQKELFVYIGIMLCYLIYSYVINIVTSRAILLDILQQIRPYVLFYTTLLLAPEFNISQKKLIKCVLLVSFIIYVIIFKVRPDIITPFGGSESAALGQLAMGCGISYYCFSDSNKKNQNIAIFIVLIGLLSGKSKYFGECVVFIVLVYYVKRKIRQNLATLTKFLFLIAIVLFFTWTKFDAYYVEGFNIKDETHLLARPETYKVALRILYDYFPFGSGLGSFATAAAAKEYSPLYFKYGLSTIWGLTPENPMFLADCFYPTLAQFGVVGIIFFLIFWKRRIKEVNDINNMVYYKMGLMCIFALAIESTADTSYLSGKGMGYFMLLAICVNSNLHQKSKHEFNQEKTTLISEKLN